MFTRRTVLSALAAASIVPAGRARGAAPLPKLTVTKDPTCGCCKGWAEHVQAAGFPVEVVETQELNRLKARLGVPANPAACHTAEVDGYVLDGHVPADSVARLLRERPAAKGLAVPGMPQGSPSMETGVKDPYQVVLFGTPEGARVYETR